MVINCDVISSILIYQLPRAGHLQQLRGSQQIIDESMEWRIMQQQSGNFLWCRSLPTSASDFKLAMKWNIINFMRLWPVPTISSSAWGDSVNLLTPSVHWCTSIWVPWNFFQPGVNCGLVRPASGHTHETHRVVFSRMTHLINGYHLRRIYAWRSPCLHGDQNARTSGKLIRVESSQVGCRTSTTTDQCYNDI